MPSWPSGTSLCTVTFGPVLDGAGDKASLTGELTLDGPSRKIVWSATTTMILSAKGVVGATTTGKKLEFTVPHVDQAGFVDGDGNPITNWGYTLEVTARWGERVGGRWVVRDKKTVTRRFQPVVGQSALDLTPMGEGEFTAPVGGPPLGAVLSFGGLTGHISDGFSPDVYRPTALTTTALLAAVSAASAAGGGVVDLRQPFVRNPVYLLNAELVIPTNVDVIGDGGNFVGDSGPIVRCTSATARVVFEGRGGESHGFTVDGDGTGDPDGLLVWSDASPVVVGRSFSQITVTGGVGDGWRLNSGQNNLLSQCMSIGNAGTNWILDKGAGGNKFNRCGSSGHGEYGLVIRQTAGGVSPYPTAPSHNQFDHCIWECQNTNVTGVVQITASGTNHFYSCGFAGNVTGTVSSGRLVDVDGSGGALNVHFESPFITGKNGDTSNHGIRVDGLAQVVLTGHRFMQFMADAHHSDATTAVFQDYGQATYTSVTAKWGEGTAGDQVNSFSPHGLPHQWSLPALFNTAWSVKQDTDAGIRAYVDTTGAYVLTGGGSGFTNKGKFGYSASDDGPQISGGPLRIAAGHARTIDRQTGVSGAVTIDAKTTSHAVLELTGNVTSVTVNNPQSGQRLTVTIRQDATGGRTVTWGAAFKFNANAAPGLTTLSTENTVEFYYDSVNSRWKELNRAVGVPVS